MPQTGANPPGSPAAARVLDTLREKARRGESLSAEEVHQYKAAINQDLGARAATPVVRMPSQAESEASSATDGR